jgi:hypothetical protein
MSIGIDCGTMFLVKSEIDDISESASFTSQRNVFLKASSSEDTEQTLKENNWSYVKHDNDFYILGEDAIKIKNLLTIKSNDANDKLILTKISGLRRPMKDGILNVSEEKLSIAIIQKLIGLLLNQPPKKNEVLCFCAPADPIDTNASVVFHKTMLTSFFQSLGYVVECIPEAMAIIYSERPVVDDPDEGEVPFSGISLSFGAGQVNCCLAFKKMPLISFSVTRSGDWIDQEASKISGVDVSVITKFKEKNLNLEKINMSDMKQAALDIFYQNMIENVLNKFSEKFNQLQNQIDYPLEIVVAGGTASVPGFLTKFKNVLNNLELPFKVKNVRLAENPLYTVANGCLIKAMSTEKKQKENKGK